MKSSPMGDPSLYETEYLKLKVKQLENKLAESEQALAAIQEGNVDAVLVRTVKGENIFTLKGAEEPYRVFLEQMSEGAVTVAEDGTILYCNQSFARAMRSSLDRVIGTKIESHIRPDSIASFQGILVEGFKDLAREDIQFKAADGAPIPMRMTISALRQQEERTYHLVTTDISERIQAEKALKESELRFDQMAKHSGTITWQVDARGTYTYVSDVSKAILGYHPEELVGKKHFYDLHPESGREAFKKATLEFFEHMDRFHDLVNPMQTKDGQTVWVATSGIPLLDEEGDLRGYQGSDTDITERKRAEAEIKRLSSELQTIFDNTPAMIWYKDTKNNFVRVNHAAAASVGLAVDRIEGHNASELFPQDAEGYYHDDLEVIAHGLPKLGIEEEFNTSGGETRWVRTDKIPLRDAAEAVTGILVISQDVTEQRHAREELLESETKFREIFNNAVDGIHINEINPDFSPGLTIDVNDAGQRMLGYSREEMLCNNPRDFTGDFYQPPMDEVLRLLREGGMAKFETKHRHRDGRMIPVEITAHVVTMMGRPTVLAVVRDITERKKVEEALHEANRKLNLLSSITRHDIVNQMTVLEGSLVLLKKRQPQLASNELLKRAEDAAERVSALTQFTKEYQDIGVKAPAWASPGHQTAEAFAMLHPVGVELRDDTHAVELLADPLAEKVPYNLIDNSMRHGEHVTRVKISAEQRGDALLLVYEDDGVGIRVEDKKRLFEKGFGKNTGFGLFLTREILAITGITITETGKAGEGVRFEMLVPAGAWRLAPPR